MARELNDDEQLDELKGWWKRYGNSLLTVALLIAAAFLAWNAWQNYQARKVAEASNTFDQLLALTTDEAPLDAPKRDQADKLVGQLVNDHGQSLYADMARMIQARIAVDSGELDKAIAALNGEIEKGAQSYFVANARIDLARLQVERQHFEDALNTLSASIPESLASRTLEVKGDALRGLKRLDDARTAYRDAMQQADAMHMPKYGLQLKLDDIAAEETH